MKIDLKPLKGSIQKAGKKAGRILRKRAPEILTGVSMISGVAATVVACKETRTIDEVIEPYQVLIDEARESGDRKELAKLYGKAFLALAKHYGPAIALQVFSIGTSFGSYKTSKNRYTQVSAAYLSSCAALAAYRDRAKELLGEEKENLLNAGLKEVIVDDVYVDEKGKKKKTKRTELVPYGKASPYTILFDISTNTNYNKDPDINFYFLRRIQQLVNSYLQRDKIIFLNEVLEELGYDKNLFPPEGQFVGWYIDDEHPNTFIDFGIYNVTDPVKREFVMGGEPSIWLTFNVMPDAWMKLGEV